MGAYLSQPVTDKETFVGGKAGFLEYGGSSMQVSGRTMAVTGRRVRCTLKRGELGITALSRTKQMTGVPSRPCTGPHAL